MAASEQALLELKRARLLSSLGGVGDQPDSQQQQQQQQEQEQEQGAAAGTGGRSAQALAAGDRVVLRYTDGRHYQALVLAPADAEGMVTLRLAAPTRQHHLGQIRLPAVALTALPASAAASPALSELQVGRRVVVLPPCSRTGLWVEAEVVGADAAAQAVTVTTVGERQRHRVALAAVALSAYAADPDAGCGSGSGSGSEGGAVQPRSTRNGRSSSSSEEGSGSDPDAGSSEEGSESSDGEGEGVQFGRVSVALADAAALAVQQAAAGQQVRHDHLYWG